MTYVSNPKHFLAQSMDKRYYFHPTTADLMAYCTPGHHKVCSYQPPLHDAGQDLSCEYAVFTNSRHITKDTCKYSISSNPIEPKIVPLNSTTYLVLNVTEYTINCKGMTDTRSGCVTCLLVLTQSCECIITYHSTTLFPQYSQCDSTTTSTEVKYPRNLMVAKLLLPDKDLHHLQGDTLGDSPADIALPPLKIFDDKIANGVALDKKDDLDLQKVLDNLQNDQTSYSHLAEELYDTHIQPIRTRLSITTDYLPWLNLALTIATDCFMLFLFCKLRILGSAIALQATQVRGLSLGDNTFTNPTPPPTEWYHPLVVNPTPHTAALLSVIIVLLVAWCFHELILLGIRNIKWCRNFTLRWPRSPHWDLILQIAHKTSLITVYLGSVPVLSTDYSTITQNVITRVKIVPIFPCLVYKLSITYPERALLNKENTLWHVPHTAYVSYTTANKIKHAHRNPPLRYRIMIGQDGIFQTPPLSPRSPDTAPEVGPA